MIFKLGTFLAAVVASALGAAGVLAHRVDAFARTARPPTRCAAIVVLGARVLPSGRAADALVGRAEKAAALYHQGLAPLVIFSGGASGSLPSEASVARDIAVRLGVPPEACLLEEQSHSTFENAQLTAPLLNQRKIAEVLLVSDRYHLLRASLQFAQVAIRTQPVGSDRRISARSHAYWTMREAFALLRRPAMLWP